MPLQDRVVDTDRDDVMRVRIVDALFELAREKPFDRVTVGDICARVGVSRQTFYRHFASKYAASLWYWKRLASSFIPHVGVDMTLEESLVRSFELARDYMPVFTDAAVGGGMGLDDLASAYRAECLEALVTDRLGLELTPRLAFQIEFFADGEMRAIEENSKRAEPYPPETMAGYLASCVPAELASLVAQGLAMGKDPAGAAGPGGSAGVAGPASSAETYG